MDKLWIYAKQQQIKCRVDKNLLFLSLTDSLIVMVINQFYVPD